MVGRSSGEVEQGWVEQQGGRQVDISAALWFLGAWLWVWFGVAVIVAVAVAVVVVVGVGVGVGVVRVGFGGIRGGMRAGELGWESWGGRVGVGRMA